MSRQPNTIKRKSVILIHGGDEFAVSAKAQETIDTLILKNQHDLGLSVIDANAKNSTEALLSLKQCMEDIRTVGFLGLKVVWLKKASFLGIDQMSKTKAVQESANTLASAISAGFPANHTLLVTASSVDAKSEFLQACRKYGEIIRFDSHAPWERQKYAIEYAKSAFQKHGLRAKAGILEALTAKTGNDIREIDQEICKLAVYMADRKDVQQSDIESIVSGSGETFAWTFQDNVAARDAVKSLKTLHQLLLQNEDPIGLIACLESRFKHLSVLREALDKKWIRRSAGPSRYPALTEGDASDEIKRMIDDSLKTTKGKMTPQNKNRLAGQAIRFTSRELAEGRSMIMSARSAMVSSNAPSAMLLELLVIKLCRRHTKL